MRVRRVDQCPACGAASGRKVVENDREHVRRRFHALSDAKYRGLMHPWLQELDLAILRCEACGHHWYREQPDDEALALLYDAATPLGPQAARRPIDSSRYAPHMLAEMKRLFSLVARRFRNARPTLLDYGSGFGRWAQAAVDAGFVVTAYEPSAERSSRAHGKITAVGDRAELNGRSFDAVNLEQVLEHVPNPRELLEGVTALCLPHTIVRITVPNIERPPEGRALWSDWPFDGRRMHTMAPFEHLHGFTSRSIEQLALRAGFRPMANRSLWRDYAGHVARRIAGRVVTRVRPTKLLACLASAAPGQPRQNG